MTNTKKISYLQMMILLLTARIFVTLTYVTSSEFYDNSSTRILALLISTTLWAIIIIPIILFNKRFPSRTFTSLIIEKSKLFGNIFAVLYLAFMLIYTISLMLSYVTLIQNRFFPEINRYIAIAIILAIACYCASCGIEGIARSSVIIFAVFLVVFIVMAINSIGNFELLNFYNNIGESNLFKATVIDFSKNGEIIMALFLMKYIKSKVKCGLYGLLAAKLIFLSLIIFLIIGTVGDFSKLTDYPFLTLAGFAKSQIFVRYDSLYLILWTMISVTSISLFINISSGLLAEIFPKIKAKNSVIALAIFVSSLAIIITNSDKNSYSNSVFLTIALIILVGIIPAITLLSLKKGGSQIEK